MNWDVIVGAVDFVCHLFLMAHAYLHLRQAQDEGHENAEAVTEKAVTEKAVTEKAENGKMSREVIVAGIYLISYLGLAICAFIHLGEKLAEIA